jgi:hypothetical protein
MTTLSEHLSRLGRKGGKARAQKMTPKQRVAAAKKAIEARWAKFDRKLEKMEQTLTALEEKIASRSAAGAKRAKAKL